MWEGLKRFYRKVVRILTGSMNGFIDNNDYLKASALTYYTLMSLVPFLAVAFGIANGFGFSDYLRDQLQKTFEEQAEVVSHLIKFALTLLEQTRGGVIAGVGVITLIWTNLSMLGSIEGALNDIWKVTQSRTWIKKFTDYLAVMIFCPLFFVISSSMNVYVITQITETAKESPLLEFVSPVLLFILRLVPTLLSILLFIVIYLFIPNAKVHTRPRVIAGIIAGFVFQLWQWVYIRFQVEISNYGVVYGTFAALPLFLVWLQISWLIVLAGAEMAAHLENELSYTAADPENLFTVSSKTFGMLVLSETAKAYHEGEPPLRALQIAQALQAPLLTTQQMLGVLVRANILVEVLAQDSSIPGYQPSRDLSLFNLEDVSVAIDEELDHPVEVGHSDILKKVEEAQMTFYHLLKESDANLKLVDII